MEEQVSEQTAAQRLLQALERGDQLSHQAAQALLPELVEAELAGEEVDDAPRFAALLAHLDTCADCLTLYEGLLDDVALLTGDAALPAPSQTGRVRDDVVMQGNSLLRVLHGLKRRFELSLDIPNLLPVSNNTAPTTLFTDTVAPLDGTPQVTVVLDLSAAVPLLRVRVTEGSRAARWHIQLVLGAQTFEATTDEHGSAALSGFTVEQVHSQGLLTLHCVEQGAADDGS